MRAWALLLALGMVSTTAFAIEEQEVKVCAAISGTIERLQCFDGLASKYSLAPSTVATTSEESGNWRTSTDIDPLNDQEIHYASLTATSGTARYGRPISLTVRCSNNKTELYIAWQTYLGNQRIRTTYRVDKDKAETSSWSLSTDNQATFFPTSPVPLLRRISDSTSFVVNLTPYNENPVTAIFDTLGADAALTNIRKGCNW